jgi:serine/threonine protein kinase
MGVPQTKSSRPYFKEKDLEYKQDYLARLQATTSQLPERLPMKCKPSRIFLDKGNANVLLEYDENNNESVAVKEIKISFNHQMAEQQHEAEILKKLDHPNIVRFLDIKITKQHVKIYMEYMDGGSLAQKIKDTGPIYEEFAKLYLVQILKGLEYLHVKEIMHRDLKCANILCDSQGNVKLTDFGTAKSIASSTKSRVGTSGFTAPEVL